MKSSGGSDLSSGNVPKNNKWLTSSTVSLNGAASAAVSSISTANCSLKINFSHGSSVATSSHFIYAYNASDTAVAPTAVTFQVCEQGTTPWVNAGGSAAALAVVDDTTATSHDFYFLISAAATSVGLKSAFTIRDELIYT